MFCVLSLALDLSAVFLIARLELWGKIAEVQGLGSILTPAALPMWNVLSACPVSRGDRPHQHQNTKIKMGVSSLQLSQANMGYRLLENYLLNILGLQRHY